MVRAHAQVGRSDTEAAAVHARLRQRGVQQEGDGPGLGRGGRRTGRAGCRPRGHRGRAGGVGGRPQDVRRVRRGPEWLRSRGAHAQRADPEAHGGHEQGLGLEPSEAQAHGHPRLRVARAALPPRADLPHGVPAEDLHQGPPAVPGGHHHVRGVGAVHGLRQAESRGSGQPRRRPPAELHEILLPQRVHRRRAQLDPLQGAGAGRGHHRHGGQVRGQGLRRPLLPVLREVPAPGGRARLRPPYSGHGEGKPAEGEEGGRGEAQEGEEG
mmetsp:Transcript_58154/g.153140  ORF Transcript_58154/g.153140 Transcript_58154/m.153140 type:complete len:268 (+) Transcript_58154:195-998(+)